MLEYESCQLKDMDVDMDENKEELGFIPSVVSWKEMFEVPRHRVSDGGRRRRATHDKPLPTLLQCEVRREEGAEGTASNGKASSLRRDRESSCRLVSVHVALRVGSWRSTWPRRVTHRT